MGKQPRGGGGGGGKKPADNVGKGKVTPVQIAFIVDRYLHDSGYKQSRSAFRAEASSLLAKSPLHEVLSPSSRSLSRVAVLVPRATARFALVVCGGFGSARALVLVHLRIDAYCSFLLLFFSF